MPERPITDAVYDPNRLPNGQLRKGHTLRVGVVNEVSRKFRELRTLWYEATSAEDMETVRQELVKMCTSCPNPDVRLKAIVYFCDRMLGKPTERVEMDVTAKDAAPLPDLSAEEVAVLSKVIGRSRTTEPLGE